MRELIDDEFKKYELMSLEKLDSICTKNGFCYFLAFGTLLGAIRHHGFIPWDDDVDVWMPRKDYDRFVKYCMQNEESIFPYRINHFLNNRDYCMGMARFYDSRTLVVEEHVRPCNLGVFIDVYPLDGCGNSENEALSIFMKNKNLRFLAGIAAPETFEKSKFGFLANVVKWCLYSLSNLIGVKTILKKMDNNSKKHKYNSSKYVATTTWAIHRKKGKKDISGWIGDNNFVDIFERQWFSSVKRIAFENISVNVPSDYDSILKRRYGDYMELPPMEKRISHHYFRVYEK